MNRNRTICSELVKIVLYKMGIPLVFIDKGVPLVAIFEPGSIQWNHFIIELEDLFEVRLGENITDVAFNFEDLVELLIAKMESAYS